MRKQVLLANDSVAYLEIQLNKSDNVKAKDLLLVFEVTDYGDFKPGMNAYRKNRVIVSNRLTQPAWWDDWHETNGLGSWSAKKYTLFMEETKVSDMTLDRDGGTNELFGDACLCFEVQVLVAGTPDYG